MTSFTIRRAVPADAPALGRMGERSFRETFDDVPESELVPWLERTFGAPALAPQLDPAGDTEIAVAEDAGRIVGFVKLTPLTLPRFAPDASPLELKQLYVLKGWQGAGVADALTSWLIDRARARNADALYLSVYEHNARALAFYRRYAFRQVGTHPFVIGAHVDIDPVLRADLRAEVIRSGALAGVPHGFCGRRGGVTTGATAELDMGRRGQDEIGPELAENRRRVIAAVHPDAALQTLYQVHSAEAVIVREPLDDRARPHADAMVTDRPGLLLGILTADCAPVLLADRRAGVVGVAHAGWKGALAGVVERTVEAMETLGADRSRIAAAIGPCIAQGSYEVDRAFRDRFAAADPANARFFGDARAGHHLFDLEGYVAHRLVRAGLGRVEPLGLDTYADEARFYSYRRATHRGEADYGRQIAVIGL
jgi:hypothetical protein